VGVYTSTPVQLLSGNEANGTWAADWYNIVKAVTDPYTSYVPAVTGGGFSLGNGSTSGGYRQIGKAIDGWFVVIGGTTTAWGTGFSISLPVNSNLGTGAAMGVIQAALNSGAARFGGWLWQNSTASVASAREDSTRWSATVPITFASGSELRGWFHYEAA
jgi:hypothetical protein